MSITYGIDLGKSVFHVAEANANGEIVRRYRFSRAKLLHFFSQAPSGLIGMEACPGSRWLARKLAAFGHRPRIMPAQYVKPYVKSQKNDVVDAQAIVEAVRRPAMRFVAQRSVEQIDLLAMHRIRDRYVAQRTGLINQIRASLLEYGIPLRKSVSAFKQEVALAISDETNELTPTMRELVDGLWQDFQALDGRIQQLTERLSRLAEEQDLTRRLMTILGIGPLTATAFAASVGNAQQFKKGRELSAWLGLVPRQLSTGGKPRLMGITKRGNPYLRRLVVHGARSLALHMRRDRDRFGQWVGELTGRMPYNRMIIAIANKLTRIAWVIMAKPNVTYQRSPIVHA